MTGFGGSGSGLKGLMLLIPHPHPLQKGPLDLIETGKGLKVQTDKPHLVSLGSGRLSTAITLLPLEEGKSWGAAPPPHHPLVLKDIPALDPRHAQGPFCPLSALIASPRCEAVPPARPSLSWPPWTAWPPLVDHLAP